MSVSSEMTIGAVKTLAAPIVLDAVLSLIKELGDRFPGCVDVGDESASINLLAIREHLS